MKRITIIGANSYIARNMIFQIKKIREAELYLYDKEKYHSDGCGRYQRIDIMSEKTIDSINFNVDVIFMFVGKTGSAEGFDNPDIFLDINERALLYILNAYRRKKSEAKLIFPSTRLLYDRNCYASEVETSENLKTIYAVGKYACEQYLAMYHRVFGIRYTVFRICIPYGTLIPGVSSYGTIEFMLSKARKKENILLYGDGNVRRTLTHIEDLCNDMLLGAITDKCDNDVFNIGGENYSLNEMAYAIAQRFGVEVEHIPYPDVACRIESGDTVFSSEKLDGILGNNRKMRFQNWLLTIE